MMKKLIAASIATMLLMTAAFAYPMAISMGGQKIVAIDKDFVHFANSTLALSPISETSIGSECNETNNYSWYITIREQLTGQRYKVVAYDKDKIYIVPDSDWWIRL